MAEVPVTWRLSINGADQVKNALDQTTEAFERGYLTQEQMQKSFRKIATEASRAANSHRQYKNILLATNPALNAFTKGLSAAGRAARSVLTITNALNLANIAMQGTQGQVDQAMLDAEIAYKKYMDALKTGDPNLIAEAQRDLANALNEVKERSDEATRQQLQNWLTFGATAIFAASSTVNALLDLKAAYLQSAQTGGIFARAMSLIGPALPWVALALLAVFLAKLTDNVLDGLPAYDQYKAKLEEVFGENVATDTVAGFSFIFVEAFKRMDEAINGTNFTFDAWILSWQDRLTILQNEWRAASNAFAEFMSFISGGAINLSRFEMLELPSSIINDAKVKKTIRDYQNEMFYLSGGRSGQKDLGEFPVAGPPGYQGGGLAKPPAAPGSPEFLANKITSGFQETIDEITGFLGLTGSGMSPEEKEKYDKMLAALEDEIKVATDGIDATEDNTKVQDALKKATQFLESGLDLSSEITEANSESTQENTNALIALGDILTSGGGPRPVGRGGGGSSNPLQGTTPGEGQGYGTDSVGYQGDNGKWYESKEEADFNNTPSEPGEPSGKTKVNQAALGFEGIVNSPTTFKAGEAGAERVSIQPTHAMNGSEKNGKNTVIVNINVSGSVLSDMDLKKTLDRHLKGSLKATGF